MKIVFDGIEMPEVGVYSCELGVLDEGTAVLTIYTPIDKTQKSYRVISIPPHGDLKDADAILNQKVNVHHNLNRDEYYLLPIEFASTILSAPTVISATKEEPSSHANR